MPTCHDIRAATCTMPATTSLPLGGTSETPCWPTSTPWSANSQPDSEGGGTHAQCVPKWRIALMFAQVRAVPATVCKPLAHRSPRSSISRSSRPGSRSGKIAASATRRRVSMTSGNVASVQPIARSARGRHRFLWKHRRAGRVNVHRSLPPHAASRRPGRSGPQAGPLNPLFALAQARSSQTPPDARPPGTLSILTTRRIGQAQRVSGNAVSAPTCQQVRLPRSYQRRLKSCFSATRC
jgi:hypothetical protein